MKIAIIGAGHIGGTLARGLSKHGHQLTLGVRDTDSAAAAALTGFSDHIKAISIAAAAAQSTVIILAVPFSAVPDAARLLGDVKDKVIIETTNPFGKKLDGYSSSVAALKEITGSEDVAKCFNSIGAESLADPNFGTSRADNFVAGTSGKAKEIAAVLSSDMGFASCFDLGGDEAIPIIENIAQMCMALAVNAKLGRRVAFKVLH
jgi:8-hydroxy-5-deazaflavin:NADPH oxidoreductase